MLDYQLVQLVPEVVRAGCSTVAVIYSKEGATGPIGRIFELWLDDIQNYGYSILVVIPDDSLMCVGSIRCYHTVSFAGILGRFIGLHELYD